MAEGRVRRLRIKAADGSLILEIPLSVGAIAGGARAKIEIVREGPSGGAPGTP